jgi:nucleoside-diphosphate-sugar epimerase
MPAREARKVGVLGGTGRVGHVVVEEALDAGHASDAGRGPDTGPAHERLEVVRGDATDPGAVERLVRGCDSVISAIGHRKDSPPDVQTVAVRHAIAAMEVHGTRRLVSLTVGAVPDPRDRPRAVHRLAGFIGRTVARTQVADAMEHAAVVGRRTWNGSSCGRR